MRILVMRFGALGDILLTLPAVELLKRRDPELELYYLCHARWVGLLELCPSIDRVLGLAEGESLMSLIQRARTWQVDLILDLHNSARSWLLGAALSVPYRSTQRPEIWRIQKATVMRRVRILSGTTWDLSPVWQRNLELATRMVEGMKSRLAQPLAHPRPPVQPLAQPLAQPPALPLLRPHRRAEPQGAITLAAARTLRIALLPGAHWHTKRWPLKHFMALARALEARDVPLLLVGSAAELDQLEALRSAAPRARLSAGPWSEVVMELEACAVAVGNDSGLTHLAEALGVPVLALFGPTVPGMGFSPRLEASRVLELELACRPCTLHGDPRCPRGHHHCLELLSPTQVLEALLAMRAGAELDRCIHS